MHEMETVLWLARNRANNMTSTKVEQIQRAA